MHRLDCGLDEFEELAGAGIDPGDSAAVERDGWDRWADDDTTVVFGMSHGLLDVGGLEAEVVGPRHHPSQALR